ncbi:MAG TPA: glycosyltransferase [Candidatus Woesearchaeota archaeon]|nr:glycosyltransferase [Candidatus Woesearchaeota archaeon]
MISIIIPTLNEEKYLPKLLECIKKQTFRDFEVIVADNHSKDKTRQIAQEYGCKVVDGGLPGAGRNNGAKAAKGDYFIFFDADVAFDPKFIEKSFNEFQKRYLEITTCLFVPDSKEYTKWFELYNAYAKTVQYIRPSCSGAFMLMTRRIFERVQGFDEELKIAEDQNFVKKAHQISKFRILESVKITMSVRRFEKENIIKYVSRAIRSEMHRSLVGEIKDDTFKYEFGNYKQEEQDFKKQKTKLNELIKKFKKNKKRKGEDK